MAARDDAVVVLGGGLGGVAAAYGLALAGFRDVTLVERGDKLGGLAGSFERDGRTYPLGYHHILHRDKTLLYFLDRIGALDDVAWRRIRMLFRTGDELFDLGRPRDFLRFPLGYADKLRFVRMMLRANFKRDWSDWHGRSGQELVDTWASPAVRRALFDPLCRIKFERSAAEVSGAWLGARLYYREGSAALGYIPDANWTTVLCEGVTRLVEEAGVNVLTSTEVTRVRAKNGRAHRAELSDGSSIGGDLFVSALPTEVYTRLTDDDTDEIHAIRYTALISAICATDQRFEPEFYWLNLATPGHAACGIFKLSSLNPTIGAPRESCMNFVTHLADRRDPRFSQSDDELMSRYSDDCRKVFGFELQPKWTQVNRVPMYSPIFGQDFVNPPPRSRSLENVYFAGNYRTFPSVASTGTALWSGIEASEAIFADRGLKLDLADEVRRYAKAPSGTRAGQLAESPAS